MEKEFTQEEMRAAWRQYHRQYRAAHREQERATAARYYQRNRERINAYSKAYQKAHPEKVRQWRENTARRLLERAAESKEQSENQE